MIVAKNRHDLDALIQVRKFLEAGRQVVRVAFLDGSPGAMFRSADLPLVIQKLIYSI